MGDKFVQLFDIHNMKFSTVLGTFALSALEANRALASPLEPVSLGAQSLEERNTEYCCFQM